MNPMSRSHHARLPQAFTSVLLRLVTLTLLIGVFGALAAHHSDGAPADPANSATSAVAATGPQSDSPIGETATTTSDTSWLVAAGCAALALCCVLGLALAKRATRQDPPPLVSTSPSPRSVSPRTPSTVAPVAPPSLLDLSISRT